MRRGSGGHHFAHWFLYSSAYDSWRRLQDWFQPRPSRDGGAGEGGRAGPGEDAPSSTDGEGED